MSSLAGSSIAIGLDAKALDAETPRLDIDELPVRPDLNASPHLANLVSEVLDHDQNHTSSTSLLERIVEDEGDFGRTYRPELFRAHYQVLYSSRNLLNPTEESPRLVEHLRLIDDSLLSLSVNEMHVAERMGWSKLLNQHLCFLTVIPEWKDSHTEHLRLVSSIFEKIVFECELDIDVIGDLRPELINSLNYLLEKRTAPLLKEIDVQGNVECLNVLTEFAGKLCSPELRGQLQDTFKQINLKCIELDPDNFGGGMTASLSADDGDFDEYAEDDDSNVATIDPENEHESTDEESEVTVIEGELTFEEEQELSFENIVEELVRTHDILLNALLEIPDADPNDTFWVDVLSENTYFMFGWPIAAIGLSLTSTDQVQDFLPELVRAATEDSLAVAHLLNIMSLNEIRGDACLSDMPSLIVGEIAKLERPQQRSILNFARSLFKDACEIIDDVKIAEDMFETLKQALRKNK